MFTFGIALILMMGVQSCKKECDVVPKDSQPNQLGGLFNFATFKVEKQGSGIFEYGCLFKPKVNGKVTALSCLMPDIDIYSVVLWDSASKTVLANENINNLDTLKANSKSISPIAVNAGKTYLISVKSVNKRWFNFTTLAGGAIKYPLSNQYISVTGYLWQGTTLSGAPQFPLSKDNSYVAGLADFSFQPD